MTDALSMGDLALITLQADTLFRYDQAGRMLSSNEEDPDPAPRVFIGASAEGIVRRYRFDLTADLVQRIDAILPDNADLFDTYTRASLLGATADLLAASGPVSEISLGPAYVFPETLPETPGIVEITLENVSLAQAHFTYTAEHLADLTPCCAAIVDGVAVSMCNCARRTPHAAEASLYTEEAFRGRGLAPLVTAAWARAVRRSGRIPLYSTDEHNLASQAVAGKLGLRQYGLDISLV